MERTSHLLRLRKSKSKYGFPELDDYSRVIKEEAFSSLWPSQSYKEAMEKEHDKEKEPYLDNDKDRRRKRKGNRKGEH